MKNSRGGQCNNVNINRMFDLEHEDQKLRKMHCDTAVEQVHMQEHIHTISPYLQLHKFLKCIKFSNIHDIFARQRKADLEKSCKLWKYC